MVKASGTQPRKPSSTVAEARDYAKPRDVKGPSSLLTIGSRVTLEMPNGKKVDGTVTRRAGPLAVETSVGVSTFEVKIDKGNVVRATNARITDTEALHNGLVLGDRRDLVEETPQSIEQSKTLVPRIIYFDDIVSYAEPVTPKDKSNGSDS